MSQQAIITLKATTTGLVPPTRVLKLNPDRLSVPIGRASKSVSKGLISAEDNAWFDNPVMSRDHAELVFDPDDMAILIKDIRSMHGTMVNDQKVPVDTLQQITTGDVLSFGAEVRRGPDTFPPCCFSISYEFVPWTSVEIPLDNLQSSAQSHTDGRGFQFPDSSDIEDGQDLFEEENISREGDVTPVESPLPKTSTAAAAIDLTKEDSLPADATSQGLVAEGLAGPPGVTICMEQDLNIQSAGRVENPIRIDDVSSDESDDDEIEESEQPDEVESDVLSEEDSDKENMEESSDEPEDAVEESVYDSDSSGARPPEDNQDGSTVSDSHNEPHQVHTRMFYDNKDIPISSLRSTVVRLADDNTQEDNQDQTSYSKTTAHYSWSNENIDERLGREPTMPNASPPSALNTSEVFVMGEDRPCINNENLPQICPYAASDLITGSAPGLNPQTQSIHRQPSPSDAAMAKSFKNGSPVAPSSNFDLAGKVISPTCDESDIPDNWNQAKAQSLGDKSGKYEFFQAREINRARAHVEESRYSEHKAVGDGIAKAKFNHLGHPYNPRPHPAINSSFSSQPNYNSPNFFCNGQRSYQPTVARLQPTQQQQQKLFQQQQMANQHHLQKLAQRQHMAALATQMAAQNVTQQLTAQQRSLASRNCLEDFSAYSTTCPGPLRSISPEPDMTSAVKFNQSQRLIAAQRATSQPSRSAVRIDDIVERSVVEPTIKSLKRKASEISDISEEEVCVWASSDSSIIPDKLNPSPDQVVGSSTPKSGDGSSTNDAAVAAGRTLEQPAAKKLKRFAENVAYFALGGIALSAGLFSILVNTAPDFPDA